MLNIKSPCSPDTEEYMDNLGATGTKIYIDKHIFLTKLHECAASSATYKRLCDELISLITALRFTEADKDSVWTTLVDYCNIPESRLKKRNANSEYVPSLDMAYILEPLREYLLTYTDKCTESQHFALELVELYMAYRKQITRYDSLRKKIKRFTKSDQMGWEREIYEVGFHYEQRETGRFYTNSENVQGYPKLVYPSFTVPKDYFIIGADMPQIDLRIAYEIYLKMPGTEIDKIYQAATDKYRGVYEIISKAENPNEEVDFTLFDQFRNKGYKTAALAGLYQSGLATLIRTIRNEALAKQMHNYYSSNPRYTKYIEVLKRVIRFGIELPIEDYFGFKRIIPVPAEVSGVDNTSKSAKLYQELLAKGCNTPIQSTTNSLIMLWSNAIVKDFRDAGFGPDKFRIYMNRHDEALFMAHISTLPYMYLFENNCKIAVDDWDTITLTPELGFYYKTPNKILMEAYKNSVENNKDKLTERSVFDRRKPVYSPLQDVIEVFTYDLGTPKNFLKMLLIQLDFDKADIPYRLSLEEVDAFDNETCTKYLRMFEADKYVQAVAYFKYQNTFIVRSPKSGKYKCIPSLDVAVGIVKAIGGNMLLCHNCTASGFNYIQDVYIKTDNLNAFDTKRILEKMETLGYPTEFVELD